MSDVDVAVADAAAISPHTGRVDAAEAQTTATTVRAQVTVAFGSVPHEARCGGLGIRVAGVTPPALAFELIDPADPDTVIGDLSDGFDRSFTDTFNGEGRVQISLFNDDPALAAVDDGMMLRVRYKGVYAMLATVGHRHRQTLAAVSVNPDSAEEADEVTTVEGAEALDDFATVVTYPGRWLQSPNPKPKEQDRQYNAGTAPYDDSGWPYAKQLQRQGDVSALPLGWGNYPPAFPDPDAYWIAGGDGTITEAPPLATMHIRRSFLVGVIGGTAARSCRLYYGADDFVTVFLDGQQMSETLDVNSRYQLRYVDFDLSDGEHTLYFVVGNIGAWEPYNPMGLVWSLQEMLNGEPIGVVIESLTGFALHSSGHDKVLWNPAEPPGVNAGMILLVAIFETFARLSHTYWTWDFTVDVDSAGNAWPSLPNWVTPVGGDVRDMVRALITAGIVDLRVDPYRPLLHAYVGGTFTAHSGVTFGVPVEGVDHSLSELVHDNDGPRANVLLVEFANGRIEVAAPGFDPMTDRRVEAALNLGRVPDEATARAQALAVLATAAIDNRSVAAGWEPVDDTHDPYVNPLLIPGYTVDVANADLDGVDRVLFSACTVREDDDGVVTVTPELADLAALRDQLTRAWLERAAPNQMGGVYPIGSVPAAVGFDRRPSLTPGVLFSLGTDAGAIVDAPSHMRCQPRDVLVSRYTGANAESFSGTSVVTLYVNGAVIATVTIPAGQSTGHATVVGVAALNPGSDRWAAKLTTSNGARHTALLRTEAL